MSKKNANPYDPKSNYYKLFGYWKKKQVATRQEMIEHAMSTLGMTESAAKATVTVLLSPREKDGRGDCRGNFSAKGHVYYADTLNKKKGEAKRFRLRYRKQVMEPRSRQTRKVEAKKVRRAKTQTKQKAEATA
jgi:hypothetical protein